MPTFQELREQAGVTTSELARHANVDFKTAKRADNQQPVQKIKALALLRVINERLGTEYTVENVEGLQIRS